MPLVEYRRKRDFSKTPEPSGTGRRGRRAPQLAFVVQKHDATRLHYDFRLEMEGVLRSWAVPKGPSLRPSEKRLAVHVEDHPISYGDFEGVIPEGQYGGGTVLLWDRGVWHPDGDPVEGYRKGKLKFRLEGEKLNGGWTLVRMGGPRSEGGKNWLLIKERDETALKNGRKDVTEARPESVDTGRSLEQIARERDRVWGSSAKGGARAAKRKPAPASRPKRTRPSTPAASSSDPAGVAGARRGTLPAEPEPQLATLRSEVPTGADWIHELKYDGYRLLVRVAKGRARILTRRGKDWTGSFPGIVEAVQALPVESALIDGEAVVLLPSGASSFQALQEALGGGERSARDIVFFAFDLLHLDGWDLTRAPLVARKEALAGLLAGPEGALRLSDHVLGQGPTFYERACRLGLEGIVSKRADAPYRPGRGHDWLKIKCQQRQEFVVGAWTDPRGSRTGIGALVLGYHEDGALRYAGKVGTGFTGRDLDMLYRLLAPLERDQAPFADPPRGAAARAMHWVEPDVVVEIEFTEWTRDGQLRHPSFKGVRKDKRAAEVVREVPQEDEGRGSVAQPAGKAPTGRAAKTSGKAGPAASRGRAGAGGPTSVLGVRLTSPERVLWPGQGVTKLALARYYERVADWMLPHAARRPLSLVRCPQGADKPCFFQKHPGEQVPDTLGRVDIVEKKKTSEYVYVETADAFIALVQIGTLEIHAWGSRVDKVEHPDLVIFDLDPDPSVTWERVVEAAHELRDRLDTLGLESWVKTTGGKGLHVVAPLARRQSFDEVKAFSEAVALRMVKDAPTRYVATMSKAKRKGKIFVDYLRNGRGSTAIVPYSSRVFEGAPVSVPIRWVELDQGVRANEFTVETLPARLARLKQDPWEGFLEARQSITKKAWAALAR